MGAIGANSGGSGQWEEEVQEPLLEGQGRDTAAGEGAEIFPATGPRLQLRPIELCS